MWSLIVAIVVGFIAGLIARAIHPGNDKAGLFITTLLGIAGSLLATYGGRLLGLYGEKDTGIPLDTVDKMKAALSSGSPQAKASEFVVYPDAPHAFHADYRASYRKEAAEDGWKRALAWFKTHGVV